MTGKVAEAALEKAGIQLTKTTMPFNPETLFIISGIRLDSPVAAVRRCGVDEVLTTYDTPAEAEVS